MLQHELAPEQSALIIRDLLQPAFKRQVSLAGLFRTLAHRAFRLVLSLDSRPHGLRAMSQILLRATRKLAMGPPPVALTWW